MDKSSLGDRIKKYESACNRYLINRMPVILRLDACAAHTWTKGLNRPFDEPFNIAIGAAAKKLVEKISGAVFAYYQSDEISVLLAPYKKLTSQPWFDNRQNKVESVSASIATAEFNKLSLEVNKEQINKKGFLHFDARAFNIPREEVVNAFLWRQQDCTRNSIQMVGQANFSHKQLQNKSCDQIQEMLFQEKDINWNDLPTYQKRGTAVYKKVKEFKGQDTWVKDFADKFAPGLHTGTVHIDKDIPIFSKDRDFIQKWVDIDKEDHNEKDI